MRLCLALLSLVLMIMAAAGRDVNECRTKYVEIREPRERNRLGRITKPCNVGYSEWSDWDWQGGDPDWKKRAKLRLQLCREHCNSIKENLCAYRDGFYHYVDQKGNCTCEVISRPGKLGFLNSLAMSSREIREFKSCCEWGNCPDFPCYETFHNRKHRRYDYKFWYNDDCGAFDRWPDGL